MGGFLMKKTRVRYTLEFKLEAVRLVGAGQSIAADAAALGLADQTLHNWLKADREGRLGGPGESLWDSLKLACVYGRRFRTRAEAIEAVMNWLAFYNAKRLHW
jgi:transposase-like protein